MDILALIISLGLGFGVSLLIFSSLLIRSNDIGNAAGSKSQYTFGIDYEIRRNNLSRGEADSFGSGYISGEETLPTGV